MFISSIKKAAQLPAIGLQLASLPSINGQLRPYNWPHPQPLGEGLGVRLVVGRVEAGSGRHRPLVAEFFLLLPLSSEYAEQVKEEVDEVEIKV